MATKHSHIELTCPICQVPGEAVGRMSDRTWYCFHCKSHGSFTIGLVANGNGGTQSNAVSGVAGSASDPAGTNG